MIRGEIVFIVGMSRSGTTLMARVLGKGPNAVVLRETHLFREFGGYLLKGPNRTLPRNSVIKIAERFGAIQRHSYYGRHRGVSVEEEYPGLLDNWEQVNTPTKLIEYLLFSKADGKVVVDQTPNHVFCLDLIRSHFSNARILNMVRDPRAVVYSQKNKWRTAKRKKEAPFFEVVRSWCNYHPLTQALLWKRSIDAFQDHASRHEDDACLTVRFEQFVRQPDEVLRQVTGFCGISFREDMLDVDLSGSSNIAGRHAGFVTEVTNRWPSGLSASERWLIERIAGEQLNRFDHCAKGPFDPLGVLGWLLVAPFQVALALILNVRRLKNPVVFFTRFFGKSNVS